MTKRYAIIDSEECINIAIAESPLDITWVESDIAQIGDLFDGQQFNRPDPIFSVPDSVSPAQARVALIMMPATDSAFPNLLAQVESGFADLPEPERSIAEARWEYSLVILRTDPLVAQMAQMLGLTEHQLDQMFIAAAAL